MPIAGRCHGPETHRPSSGGSQPEGTPRGSDLRKTRTAGRAATIGAQFGCADVNHPPNGTFSGALILFGADHAGDRVLGMIFVGLRRRQLTRSGTRSRARETIWTAVLWRS